MKAREAARRLNEVVKRNAHPEDWPESLLRSTIEFYERAILRHRAKGNIDVALQLERNAMRLQKILQDRTEHG